MSEDSKFFIKDSDVPKQWYNLVADLKEPMSPPLNPGTKQPLGPDDLAPLFPMDLIMQEVSQERYIDIPGPVLEAYSRWRCTPLVRARALEKALDTPARIYYKYEGASPSGSHKPNTALAQAFYNKEAGVKKIATENNILLIFDEVQTGFGRTGEMFGANTVGVTPDMATLAKGIAGGFPLAGVIGKSNIMDSIHDAGIGSTFGASPVSCAAALGVLEVFDEENILENVKRHSEIMKETLNTLRSHKEFIGDVRGYGTMIGVEIVEDTNTKNPSKDIAMKIIDNSKNEGLLLVNCGLEGNVIRFMGPLTTPDTQVHEAMEMFSESVNAI